MRHLTRLFLALAILAGPAAGTGHADSGIRDLLLLKEAGLSDDILIDLIQSDGSVFHLKAADIIDLHKQGLSDRVIRAMLATARKPDAPATPPVAGPDQAQTTVTDVPDAPMEDRARLLVPPQSDEVMPVTSEPPPSDAPVAVWPSVPMPAAAPTAPGPIRTEVVEVYVPVAVPVAVERRHSAPPAPPPAPVYWGNGGQKKPGSWDEPQAPTPPASTLPATKPAPPKGGGGGL